jgi:hypothetical protein
MSNASEWIVVPTHREFPSISQFVPVEPVMWGSLRRAAGPLCALAGNSTQGKEPPVTSRSPLERGTPCGTMGERRAEGV